MIKFFRKIRQKLLSEGKTGKYLKYAIGEILLVVIGILIALQINNWNEASKKKKLKQVYIESLINDLTNDTIQLNARIELNKNVFIKRIDSIVTIIRSPTTTVEDIKALGQNVGVGGLRVVNNYNTKTFNALASSGNIDLFDDRIVQKIMELNVLQNYELNISSNNRNIFFDLYNRYRERYLQQPEASNELIAKKLWNRVNAHEHAAIYINVINVKLHTATRYTSLTEEVVKKTEELIETLKSSLVAEY